MLDILDIDHGSTVLDIGYGSTDELLGLSRAVGNEGTVYAIEPNAALVSRTLAGIRGTENIRIFLGSAYETSLPDKSIDAVLLKGVLHEVGDVLRAIREAKRVSREPGKIIIVDFQVFPKTWLMMSNLTWRLAFWRSGWSRSRILSSALDKHPGFSKNTLEPYIVQTGLQLHHYQENFASGRFYGHNVPLFRATAVYR